MLKPSKGILTNPSIRNFYYRCSVEEQELFNERAAIIEFDGNMSREQAEYKAFVEVLSIRRAKTFNLESNIDNSFKG